MRASRGESPGMVTKDEEEFSEEQKREASRQSKRTGAGREGEEGDRMRGNGQRKHSGWNGAIAREKVDASERDGRPAKTRALKEGGPGERRGWE